jgi:hypothetical protein
MRWDRGKARFQARQAREIALSRAPRARVGVRYPRMGENRTEPVRGDSAATAPGDPGGSGFVTTKVAAEALGVNPRTVRAYIERGDLEAKAEGEGIQKTYLVSIDSVYALRDRRGWSAGIRRQTRVKPAEAEVAADDLTSMVRDLTAELIQSTREAAELRTRLELTARAESTVKEERDGLREELRKERERALELEMQLRESRKGFWRRLFGG